MLEIPLFQLNYGEEEIEAITETIRGKWISTGPKCIELENLMQDMLQVKYAVALSNCTDALHLACVLCGFGPGDEVLVPSLTFAASANCIRYVGATPVFCDIAGLDDMTIDPKEIEKKITPKTRGIVVVHMAGFPADMDAIMRIAREHDLRVVEDACHGPMSEYHGKKLGTIGDVGCFSFFSNKNISTGEGGAIVTNNDAFGERARLLRSHGMTTMSYQRASGHATKYDVVDLGYNYRMDDMRASLAVVQWKKLLKDLERRAVLRKRYLERLSADERIVIPFKNWNEFSSNYIFMTVLKDCTPEKRDAIRDRLAKNGIQTSVHYPAIHKFSIYEQYTTSLPVTEYVTDNEITLPMYSGLTDENIEYICDKYLEAVKEILG